MDMLREPALGTPALVAALHDPACYPHPVDRVEAIETHISHVLLAGDFAYKLKKPVKLAFLDFSTPELRRHYCEEELRLNRRSAPGIYLDVVAIGGDPLHPRIGAHPVLEHAVRMRRFGQEALFSAMAQAGELQPAHVDALAVALSRLHEGAARATSAEPPGQPALANFFQIAQAGVDRAVLERLAPLRRWTQARTRALEPLFAQRLANGFVRECHGDLHLANVAWVDGQPLPFDGIEFSEALRWIDVASDVAFAAMDLHRLGLPRLAARFIDRYLERTGDYEAARLVRYYMVYRAMVRAKVAAIAFGQAAPGSVAARAARARLMDHLELAAALSRDGPALLVAMHGLPASGKTTVSARLVEALGGIRVRSDVERKRQHGMEAGTRAGAAPGEGIYGARDTEATYERLAGAAGDILAGGFPAIVDATFADRARRERFRALAAGAGAGFHIVSCTAPEALLRERVAARAHAGTDASDAGLAVLEERLRRDEPLAPGERALVVDTSAKGQEEALARRLAGEPA